MSYGSIYDSTYWGLPIQNGWGGIYYGLTTPIILNETFGVTFDSTFK